MKNLFFILLASSFFSCRPNSDNAYGALIKEGSAITLVDSNHVIINESKIAYTFTNKHYIPINADFCSCGSGVETEETFIMLVLHEYAKSYKILNWDAVYSRSLLKGLWIYVDSLETKVDTIITSFKVLKDTTMIIPLGGSLMGTLGMTEEEAYVFANKYNYPNCYKTSGDYFVHVEVGESFSYGIQPDSIRYLKPIKRKIKR